MIVSKQKTAKMFEMYVPNSIDFAEDISNIRLIQFIDARNFRSIKGEPTEALKSTLLHILLAGVTDKLDRDGDPDHAIQGTGSSSRHG